MIDMIDIEMKIVLKGGWPGDLGDTFFMIESGQALLVVRNDEGEEHPCGVLSAGDYIGGRAIVTETKRGA